MWVECRFCGAQGPFASGEVAAAEAWNERDDMVVIGSEQHLPYNPTADVVVLADGSRWVRERTCHLVEDEDGYTACSECGCTALCMRDAVFCPDCGARVDGWAGGND